MTISRFLHVYCACIRFAPRSAPSICRLVPPASQNGTKAACAGTHATQFPYGYARFDRNRHRSGYVLIRSMLIDNQPKGDFMKIRTVLAPLPPIGFVAATPATYAAVANVHPSVHAFFFNGE